jgi:hypothetical protein
MACLAVRLLGGFNKDINSVGKDTFLSVISWWLSLGDDLIKNLNSFTLSESASIFLNSVVNFLPLKLQTQHWYDWK